MNGRQDWARLGLMLAAFTAIYHLPLGWARFDGAAMEALRLTRWYAREHVVGCLVPALFIAGAIAAFVSKASVMKYLGPKAGKVLAYGVASVSGTILAVCSCTVLPLFAGIYRMGAGLGPATAFLYAGPAINVLAIVLTARILGPRLGIARAAGAVVFSVVIGLLMHLIYRRQDAVRTETPLPSPEPETSRPLWQTATFFAVMVGILVFANWGSPKEYLFDAGDGGPFAAAVVREPEDPRAADAAVTLSVLDGPAAGSEVSLPLAAIRARTPLPGLSTGLWRAKWALTGVLAACLGAMLVTWFALAWWKVALAAALTALAALLLPARPMVAFAVGAVGLAALTATNKGPAGEWFGATWDFARQILPLLLLGVLVAGFLLGESDREGLIPSRYVEALVGQRPDAFLAETSLAGGPCDPAVRAAWPVWTNFFAAVFGAFMYFATLTEVPILQGLMRSGMGEGPALALLLAGPALSLPSMLVVRGILGTRKTAVYVCLVVAMSTVAGMIFGAM